MRGFLLSDALFSESWTGVSITDIGAGGYNNAVSNADRVLAASPFAQWSSAEVRGGQGGGFGMQFARGSGSVLADSAAVFNIQLLGRLRTVNEVDVRSSLAAPVPTMRMGGLDRVAPAVPAQDVPLNAWSYEQPPATVGERPKVIVAYRGNMLLPLGAATNRLSNGFRLTFTISNVSTTHSVRISRVVLGHKATFGHTVRPDWSLTRTAPTLLDRTPGQYSGAVVRTPSYRTVQAEFGNIQHSNMQALNTLYHLHGSGPGAVPLVLCMDPSNLDTLIYGQFTEWRDTFKVKTSQANDVHSLRFTFEEINT